LIILWWGLPHMGATPLHVHHVHVETIHVLRGRFQIRIRDKLFRCEAGGFAYLPKQIPHAFLNLTDELGEIIVSLPPAKATRFTKSMFRPMPRNYAQVILHHLMHVRLTCI
jgi:quercetin dioxygenase-like cupin family protein